MKLVDFDADRAVELVRMWRESFEHGVGVLDPHPLEEQVHYLLKTVVPNNTIRIAVSDGDIVGLRCSDDVVDITALRTKGHAP